MFLDTCFLIDLHRELGRGVDGKAVAFLERHADESFFLSMVTVTEFLEGFGDSDTGEQFLRPFNWVSVDAAVARIASRIRRDLRQNGQLIGDFDILIAASVLSHDDRLVTNNHSHFSRVDGLKLQSY